VLFILVENSPNIHFRTFTLGLGMLFSGRAFVCMAKALGSVPRTKKKKANEDKCRNWKNYVE
jgi:hypothetical protein